MVCCRGLTIAILLGWYLVELLILVTALDLDWTKIWLGSLLLYVLTPNSLIYLPLSSESICPLFVTNYLDNLGLHIHLFTVL